jgi:fermentation-respiration switch protein FrsA (DUF1100 family)
MSGNARSLDKLLEEQCSYLLSLDPSESQKNELLEIQEKIKTLRAKDFNVNTPKDELPMDLSGYYWKSMLDYDPVSEAKKINTPVLVLQGERDYQVSMKDFNIWKKAFKKNRKAAFISYPKLNHLLIGGESPSGPAEYTVKGNVDPKIIEDIDQFLK